MTIEQKFQSRAKAENQATLACVALTRPMLANAIGIVERINNLTQAGVETTSPANFVTESCLLAIWFLPQLKKRHEIPTAVVEFHDNGKPGYTLTFDKTSADIIIMALAAQSRAMMMRLVPKAGHEPKAGLLTTTWPKIFLENPFQPGQENNGIAKYREYARSEAPELSVEKKSVVLTYAKANFAIEVQLKDSIHVLLHHKKLGIVPAKEFMKLPAAHGWTDHFLKKSSARIQIPAHILSENRLSKTGRRLMTCSAAAEAKIQTIRELMTFLRAMPIDAWLFLSRFDAFPTPMRKTKKMEIYSDEIWRTICLLDGATEAEFIYLTQALDQNPALYKIFDDYTKQGYYSLDAGYDNQPERTRKYCDAITRLLREIGSGASLTKTLSHVLPALNNATSGITLSSLGPRAELQAPLRKASVRSFLAGSDFNLIQHLPIIEAFHQGQPKAPPLELRQTFFLDDVYNDLWDTARSYQRTEAKARPHSSLLVATMMLAWTPSNDPDTNRPKYIQSSNIRDFATWLRNSLECLFPDSSPSEITSGVASIIYGSGRRHTSLFAESQKWHAVIGAYESDRAALEASFANFRGAKWRFPHMLDETVEIVTKNGLVRAKPLRSHEEILQEGVELDHCVGSYRRKASVGVSILIALSDNSGRSTAEFKITAKDVELLQHKAVKNTTPPESHTLAVEELLTQFEKDKKRRAEIDDRREKLIKIDRQPLASLSETEIRTYQTMIFLQIRPFLGPGEHNTDLDTWSKTHGAAHLARYPDDVGVPVDTSGFFDIKETNHYF